MDGYKRQTRRLATNIMIPPGRYKLNEIVYLKEPYTLERKYPCAPLDHPHSKIMRPVYAYDKQPQVRKIMKWENKLFMPGKYARYYIKIVDAYVDRLQNITEEEAKVEGFKNIAEFQGYWITLHGFSSWKENPWVYVYTFAFIC